LLFVIARGAFMTFLFGGQFGAAVLAKARCTPPIADDVKNVRIFDGKSASLSAPSNVLVKGNVLETISDAPIEAEGVSGMRPVTTSLRPLWLLNQLGAKTRKFILGDLS